jgi:hypothetical protein
MESLPLASSKAAGDSIQAELEWRTASDLDFRTAAS